MTRQIGYVPTTDQRLNGTKQVTERLLRRQQIPAEGLVPVASLRTGSSVTVAADAADHFISLQNGGSGVFDTSHPTIFANTQALSLTGTPYGLEVKVEGTYEVSYMCEMNGGTAGATGRAVLSGLGALSIWQPGRTQASLKDGWNGGTTTTDFFASNFAILRDPVGFPADYPSIFVPSNTVLTGTSVTVAWQIVIKQLSTYPLSGVF